MTEVTSGAAARVRATTLLERMLEYLRLTKPRVVELLLVTTVPPMLLAEDGVPSVGLIVAVLVGGALGAGGANAVNCVLERDRDTLMRRTHGRPLPRGAVDPARALAFALALEVAAFGVLWWAANLLAAALTLAAAVFYVVVYTIWLKPRTTQNIVIGGAAGAVPVLVGWAAVTGSLALPAWVLFGVVFLWTPPHFWALALRYREDYARAEVPMLPVVRGTRVATRAMLRYSVAVVACSLLLGVTTTVGPVYVVAAAVLGALFVGAAVQLSSDPTPQRSIRFFTFSNTYLALLFVAVAVDVLVRNA